MPCSMRFCGCSLGIASQQPSPSLSNSSGEAVNEIADGPVGLGPDTVGLMN